MAESIDFEIGGDASNFSTTVKSAIDSMDTLKKETNEFGDISDKAFKEGTDSANKYEKEIEDTTKATKKQSQSIQDIKEELNRLAKARDSSQNTDEIKKFNKQLDAGEQKVKQLTSAGKEGFDEMGNAVQDTGGRFGSMLDIAGGFGIAFGAEAIISGVIAIGGAVIDSIGQFRTLRGEVQTLTGLTGEGLDSVVVKATAIAETFDQDVNEVIKAANVLSNEFGFTQEEALAKLQSATLGVAGSTDELLEQTKEYSSQIRAAGGDADDLFNIINKSATDGVFSDKGIDVVKEFGLRIREQTQGSRDALEAAFGKDFTEEIFGGINDGSLTSIEALEKVSAKMNDSTVPASELQTVIADVFGGAGEDAGLAYLQTLTDIGGSVDNLTDTTNALTQEQIASLEAEENLANAQNELSKLFDDQTGNTFFKDLEALGYQFLVGVIEPILDTFGTLKDAFSPLFDALGELKTAIFGAGEGFSYVDAVLFPFKISLKIIGFGLGLLADALVWVVEGITDFIKESPLMMAIFDAMGDAIDVLIDAWNDLSDLFSSGFQEGVAAGKKAARELDEQFTQPILNQLEGIDKKRRDNLKSNLLIDQKQLESKLRLAIAEGTILDAEAQQLLAKAQANKTILDAIKVQETAEAVEIKKGEDEKAKIRDVANKKASDQAKKDGEKRIKELEKIEADFKKALQKAADDSEKVELDNLEGPEKFAQLKQNALDEIQILEDLIVEKGQLLADEKDETFVLAEEQVKQLQILRDNARDKEIEAVMEFNRKKALAEIDVKEETIDIKEATEIEAVEDFEKPDDTSEQDFELIKQEQILAIQEKYMLERIALLDEEIALKTDIYNSDGSIDASEQNEIDKLELAKENLNDGVDAAKDAQDELVKARGKTSIAELLGMSDDDFEDLKEGLSEALDASIEFIQAGLEAEAEANEIKLEALEEREDSVRDELETEIALSEAGFASNVAAKQQELAEIKKAKEKAQKEQEAIAKKQFLLDTALQVQGLITSSIQIIEGFSKIPIVGLPLGIAAVGAMLAFFISAKSKAYSAIGSGGSAEKGAVGDKTGMISGKRHYAQGERFLDHLEVEDGEKWGILNRRATAENGDVFAEFTHGLNDGRNPQDLMLDLLHGTGVYMKPGVDNKIQNRVLNIKQREVIMLANVTNANIEKSMESVDKNLGDLLGFEKGKIRIVPTPTGRWEIDDVKQKRKFVKYTDNGTDK